jgi:4-hydroxy-3-polyprenylbenzoate decarboxylase
LTNQKEYIIGISGASGAVYSKKLFDALIDERAKIHIVISEEGKKILKHELGLTCSYFDKNGVTLHDNYQLNDILASGSFRHEGMVIIPASMGCIGRIASGISTDLIVRAADVALKEKFPLICVPRETPYNVVHLKNMLTLSEAGAVILPASPGFYHKPESIDDISSFIVDRVLASLNVKKRLLPAWKPESN